jgi:hypothetical protein
MYLKKIIAIIFFSYAIVAPSIACFYGFNTMVDYTFWWSMGLLALGMICILMDKK